MCVHKKYVRILTMHSKKTLYLGLCFTLFLPTFQQARGMWILPIITSILSSQAFIPVASVSTLAMVFAWGKWRESARDKKIDETHERTGAIKVTVEAIQNDVKGLQKHVGELHRDGARKIDIEGLKARLEEINQALEVRLKQQEEMFKGLLQTQGVDINQFTKEQLEALKALLQDRFTEANKSSDQQYRDLQKQLTKTTQDIQHFTQGQEIIKQQHDQILLGQTQIISAFESRGIHLNPVEMRSITFSQTSSTTPLLTFVGASSNSTSSGVPSYKKRDELMNDWDTKNKVSKSLQLEQTRDDFDYDAYMEKSIYDSNRSTGSSAMTNGFR